MLSHQINIKNKNYIQTRTRSSSTTLHSRNTRRLEDLFYLDYYIPRPLESSTEFRQRDREIHN